MQEVLDHLEDLMGGSSLDLLLRGDERDLLPAPWRRFIRQQLSEGQAEAHFLKLLKLLKNIKSDSDFWLACDSSSGAEDRCGRLN